MSRGQRLGAVLVLVTCVCVIASMFVVALPGKAESGDDKNLSNDQIRARIGLLIAPVRLNLRGKDKELVGLGSYLVNQGGCNDCHTVSPVTQYVDGHNPYFGQKPSEVNPATYLSGGQDFGPLIPGSADIISRNLTPDKTGRPEGGATFKEFLHTLRTGEDPDHLHPTCTGVPNAGCIPPPFDGSLLQIMPWPSFQKLTDHDIRAIYEYLSAVPCVQGYYPNEPTDRCK